MAAGTPIVTPMATNQLSAQLPTCMHDPSLASLNLQVPAATSSLSRQNTALPQNTGWSRQPTFTSTPLAFGGGNLSQAGPLHLDAPQKTADLAWPLTWPLRPGPQLSTSAYSAHAGGALCLPSDATSLDTFANSSTAAGQLCGQTDTESLLLRTLAAIARRYLCEHAPVMYR